MPVGLRIAGVVARSSRIGTRRRLPRRRVWPAHPTTPAPPTASTPPPSPNGPSATTTDRSTPTARRSPCSTSSTIRWGLAVCHVLQARTLFDLGDDAASAVARTGVEHARRAGDRHVLGIALTQIAQIAIAADDAAAAMSAASEALDTARAHRLHRRHRLGPARARPRPPGLGRHRRRPSAPPTRPRPRRSHRTCRRDVRSRRGLRPRRGQRSSPSVAATLLRAARSRAGTSAGCPCVTATPRNSPTSSRRLERASAITPRTITPSPIS